MNWPDLLLICIVLIAVPLVLLIVPLYLLFGGLRSFAMRPLQRCFKGIELRNEPQPGDVEVVYHTYRGFLLWSVQCEHRIIASPGHAQELLGRLLRFNLTWGMLTYGFFFVPFLAIGNYLVQRRAIERQETEIAFKPTSRRDNERSL